MSQGIRSVRRMPNPLDGRIEKLAGQQHGLFTTRQARALGADRNSIWHRLVSGRWRRVHPGVLALPGASVAGAARILVAVLAVGDEVVASHTSAAALVGLPGFPIEHSPVHLSAPSYTRRARPGTVVHGTLRLPGHHRRTVDGVPCTSVARTIFDLCGELRAARAERALDHALSRRLVTLPALWRVLDDVGARGRAGTAGLSRLLLARGERYVAPESELEAQFIELVARHGLPEPRRQVGLGDVDSWIGRVDFAYPAAKLVVECDGALAHSSLLDRAADAERDQRLQAAGWAVLRFGWTDVTQRPMLVADEIGRFLVRKAA